MGGFWSKDSEENARENESPAPSAPPKKRKRKHEGVAVAKLPVRRDPTVWKRSRFATPLSVCSFTLSN